MEQDCPLLTKNIYQSGQALLIILLVMLAGLTVGLLLVSRTTTDIAITSKIEESTRAFNAAEAGIEQALRSATIGGGPVNLDGNLSYQVAVDELGGAATQIFPSEQSQKTAVGDVFTVWLVPHDVGTDELIIDESQAYKEDEITICFTDSIPPAIGVSVFYEDASGVSRSSFTGFDANSSRIASNNFLATNANSTCASRGYQYGARIDFATTFTVNLLTGGLIPIALRIQPYYTSAYLAVIPDGAGVNFPAQGNAIQSTGQSGEATRRIVVEERFTQPAPFMDHAVFSFGNANLSK